MYIKKLLPALVILISGLIASNADSIIQIPNTPLNQKLLHKLDLDHHCMGHSKGSLHFILDEEARQKIAANSYFKRSLLEQGNVVVENVHEQFDEVQSRGDLGIYHNYSEMLEKLEETAQKFGHLAKLFVAGESALGKPIHAMELGNSDSKSEKRSFLVMGSHHAREWISVEAPLASILDLLENYGHDEQATQILDNSRIVYVPMLNVDGSIHSRTKAKMWRKNRNPNNKSGVGVDNNRNYAYKWGVTGASSLPWSDTYRGPNPMSEAENQVIHNLQTQYGFTASISFHSFGEFVLWPWSYTDDMQSKDNEVFAFHGTKMAQILDYEPIQSADLYPSAGDSDDYLYAKHGVLSYTIELGTRFVPKESQVPEIRAKASKALRYLFLNARDPFVDAKSDPLYQIKGELESLAAGIVSGADLEGEASTLAGQDRETLHRAMDDLAMKHPLRYRIFHALKFRD